MEQRKKITLLLCHACAANWRTNDRLRDVARQNAAGEISVEVLEIPSCYEIGMIQCFGARISHWVWKVSPANIDAYDNALPRVKVRRVLPISYDAALRLQLSILSGVYGLEEN